MLITCNVHFAIPFWIFHRVASPANVHPDLKSDFTLDEILRATNNFAEVLGTGGQAKVYKATINGTTVAVKKFLSKDDFKSMAQETKILSKVKHPNILQYMGCCLEGLCLVSEYMAGGSLRDRLKGEDKHPQLTWRGNIKAARDMVKGLCYLHGQYVIHHDLKPGNVLFDEHDKLKLADMGLSELHGSASFAVSRTADGWKGTLWYACLGFSLCFLKYVRRDFAASFVLGV